MIVYVAFGGMIATTWVQIIKAVPAALRRDVHGRCWCSAQFGFSPEALFAKATEVHPKGHRDHGPGSLVSRPGVGDLAWPGADVRHSRPAAHPDAVLHRCRRPGRAQIGVLCDRLHRLLLHPDLHHRLRRHHAGARPIRHFSMPAILAQTKSGIAAIKGGSNMAAIHLADAVGGNLFLGFISAVAFATILAVVSGLALAGASAISHDLYAIGDQGRQANEQDEIRVSKIATVVLGVLAVVLGIVFENQNVAFMVGLAFAIAASLQLPGAGDVDLLEGPHHARRIDRRLPRSDHVPWSASYCRPPSGK